MPHDYLTQEEFFQRLNEMRGYADMMTPGRGTMGSVTAENPTSTKDWSGSDRTMGYYGLGAAVIGGVGGLVQSRDLSRYMRGSGQTLDEVYNNLSNINSEFQTNVRRTMLQDQIDATPTMNDLSSQAFQSGTGEWATTIANKQRDAGVSKAREAALQTWLRYRTEVDSRLPMLRAQIEEQKLRMRMYEDQQSSNIFGSVGGLLGAGIGFLAGGGPMGAGLGAQMGGMLGRSFG